MNGNGYGTSDGKGIYITNKIARILNRKMKAVGYPTTIKKLQGYYSLSVIEVFAGFDAEDQAEVSEMIVDAYDEAHPELAYS